MNKDKHWILILAGGIIYALIYNNFRMAMWGLDIPIWLLLIFIIIVYIFRDKIRKFLISVNK